MAGLMQPTAPPPAPVVPPPPPEPSAWEKVGLQDYHKQHGSDEAAIRGLWQTALQQQQELQRLQQLEAQVAPNWQQYQEYIAKAQKPPEPQWYDGLPMPTKHNIKELVKWVGTDPSGKVVAKPGAPPDAVLRYEQAVQEMNEFDLNFRANPHEFLRETIDRRVQMGVEQALQRHQARQQEEAQIRLIYDAYAPLYFEKDQTTPGAYNEKAVSQVGHRFDEIIRQARAQGLTGTPEMMADFGMVRLQAEGLVQPEVIQEVMARKKALLSHLRPRPTPQQPAPQPALQPVQPAQPAVPKKESSLSRMEQMQTAAAMHTPSMLPTPPARVSSPATQPESLMEIMNRLRQNGT